MRISCLKADPGYHGYVPSVEVWLDGVKLSHVFTADDETGEVLRCVIDAHGHVIPDATGTRARTEVIRGKVEFLIPGTEERFVLSA
ncbi:hypothetical protein [Chelatococcus sp.]|uniref:hypothetical protein n=1 Tax=Chelatococcus sp. TaxID=1953771 RepID=UPI001ED3D7CA|nr:hypothetical protein [Chelatococcus sp.]MBX3546889.1 hypothetical protein [Chelatococcus sp.]